MDDFLLLSYREQLNLIKYKNLLESRHRVKINAPEVNPNELKTDVVFTSITGNAEEISSVKQFLQEKSDEAEENDSVIVLSSDSESGSVENAESTVVQKQKRKRGQRKITVTDKNNLSIEIVGNSSTPPENAESNVQKHKRKRRRRKLTNQNNTSIEIIGNCRTSPSQPARVEEVLIDADNNQSVLIIEPITPQHTHTLTSTNRNEGPNEIVSSEGQKNTPDFIPLTTAHNRKNTRAEASNDAEIIELSSDEESAPAPLAVVPSAPRKLRPVVIDGSNVARSHGKPTNTFSCKGIKISVDYFLERGHTVVTAFVPRYRQFCKNGTVITTDNEILAELERKQHVVFTPSRRLQEKSYSCYDDRFIVEYAARCGGVILSNDNYKDLMDEKPSYKETIINRLLMFCFVGDMLMIPEDPLGSKGPKLDEFLSFPPDEA